MGVTFDSKIGWDPVADTGACIAAGPDVISKNIQDSIYKIKIK